MVIGSRELDLKEIFAVKLDLDPDVKREYGVVANNTDSEPSDLGGQGKGDLCAVDLQRRAEQVSGKRDWSALPRAGLLPSRPCHLAHQHTLVLHQGDEGIKDINVDLVEVGNSRLAFLLPILDTDLEERQVHGGVAHFHQDDSAGVPDGMVSTIEAEVLRVVRGAAHSHTWPRERGC